MERAQRTHSCTTHMQPLVQWRTWGSITRASDVAGLFSCKQEGTQTQHSAIYTHTCNSMPYDPQSIATRQNHMPCHEGLLCE